MMKHKWLRTLCVFAAALALCIGIAVAAPLAADARGINAAYARIFFLPFFHFGSYGYSGGFGSRIIRDIIAVLVAVFIIRWIIRRRRRF